MKLRRPDDRGGYFTGFVSHGCYLTQTKQKNLKYQSGHS